MVLSERDEESHERIQVTHPGAPHRGDPNLLRLETCAREPKGDAHRCRRRSAVESAKGGRQERQDR
jgi:hypothetical protein